MVVALAVTGAVVGLALVGLSVFFFMRRRRNVKRS